MDSCLRRNDTLCEFFDVARQLLKSPEARWMAAAMRCYFDFPRAWRTLSVISDVALSEAGSN